MAFNQQVYEQQQQQRAIDRLQAIERPGMRAGTAYPATQVINQRWLRTDLRAEFINIDGTGTGWRQLSVPSFDTLAQIKALTSVPTDFRAFALDVHFEWYYDGTRWLTSHEYTYPVVHFVTQTAASVTANPSNAVVQTSRQHTDYSIYLTRAEFTVLVATTNNGTNYWTLTLNRQDSTNAQTAIGTTNTSLATVGVLYEPPPLTPNIVLTSAQAYNFQVNYTFGAGAPGAISVYPAHLFYRLVG